MKPNEYFEKKSGKISVVIVDDHEMVRRGLSDFLRIFPEFEMIGEAADGEEAIKVCSKKKPDIVLMDLVMPRMNGVEAIRRILTHQPEIKIIALSSYDDENLVPSALDAGAISFLQKNVTVNELADAIRKASEGLSTLSPVATKFLISAAMKHTKVNYMITSREMDVLKLMVAGKSNVEISKELVISLPTVKTHVSHILSKTGAKSRSEAIAFTMKHEILSQK
jgi:two-component system, NarL family, response regulator LiaR